MNPFNLTLKLLTQEFTKAGLKILPNESACLPDRQGREALFSVQTSTGKTHDIYLKNINLNRERSIKIPKQKLGEPRDNLWVALVLQLKDMEQKMFLIPSKVLATPDNYIFIDNDMGPERFDHLSNWEIKVFVKGIEKLSEYAFGYQIKQVVKTENNTF